MKHNFNLNQIILLCENGEVTTDDGTKFQVVEVKSETVAPDYSHLVGKWVRCKDNSFNDDYFETNKWYECVKVINEMCFISDKNGRPNGVVDSVVYLDLSNPLDYNPNKHGFIDGAKWQQEQDKKLYSEEDVNEIIAEAWNSCEDNEGETYTEARKRIIEQFKKK